MRTAQLLLLASLAPLLAAQTRDLRSLVDQELPALTLVYQDLHAHPELSQHEEHTSASLADALRKAGYTVTGRVGKYADGSQAFGVVAILKNGPGPVVLARTELDALPVEEKTGLPYASRVKTTNAAGQEVGVMHACGHDLHMTALLGAARIMAGWKDRWSGTLMVVGQPAEETVGGASAMLADGLYTRFPRPDYAIAQHDTPDIEAGKVGVISGPALASSTSVDVILRGVGGHGARPEATKDPIVMAAEFIMEIQTIVSRQISPLDPAVVTVGSIHGGSKHNIIPDDVTLQLTTRSYSDGARKKILDAIERTARGVALSAGVPEDRAPIVKVSEAEYVPPTYNDPKLAARLKTVMVAALGENNVTEPKPEMGAEDFGLFGLEGRQIPIFMLRLGASDPRELAESLRTGTPLPSLHSSLFHPQLEPALRTGMLAMTDMLLDLLKK